MKTYKNETRKFNNRKKRICTTKTDDKSIYVLQG